MIQNLPSSTRLALVAILMVVLSGCDRNSPESYIASSKSYLEKREYSPAIIELKNALQKAPNSGEARYLLGKALRETGDPAGAEIELRKAAAAGHNADEVYPELLLALLESGKYEEVLAEGKKAQLKSATARATVLALQGEAYLYTGKPDDGEPLLRQALAAEPSNIRGKIALSKLAASRNDLATANRLVDEVLAGTPDHDAAVFQKAVLAQAAGNTTEAIRLYEQAATLRPSNVRAHFNLTMLHLQQKDVERAASRVAALKKIAPGSPTAFYLDALVTYTKGDKARARELIREVLKNVKDYPPGERLAGAIEHDLGNYTQAEEYLLHALSAEPDVLEARSLLASTYARTGQFDKAKEALVPLLKQPKPDIAILLLAGEVYGASGDARKAKEFYEKASALDPKNTVARTRLGQFQLATGDTAGGIEDLEAASLLDQKRADADVALVRYYVTRKEYDKALAAAEVLKKKQPDNPLTYSVMGTVELARGNGRAARTNFEKALSLQPAFLPAARSLALLDLQDGKPEVAMKRIEAVTEADPKQGDAWLVLADLKQKAGWPAAEVLPLLDRAIAANPESPRAKLVKINYLLKAGDAKEAVAAALDAQTAHPSDPRVLDALAGAQLKAGETDQAITNYGKLTALLPKSPAPYLGLAGAHVARKDWPAARDALRRATEIQPQWLPAYEAQVLLGVASNQYDDATGAAKSIQKGWPKLPVGYVAEADILAAQKRWAEAESVLRDANRRLDNAAIAGKLYSALEKQGKVDEADAMATDWSSKHPTDPTLAVAIAQGYLGRQDFQNAARWYRAATKVQPKNPVFLNNLAWCLGQSKDPAALEIGKQALAIAPRSIAVTDTVAMLYVQTGEPAKGAELLSEVVARSPRSAPLRLNYAKALIAAGKRGDAKKQLEEIAALPAAPAIKEEAAKLLAAQ